METAESARTAFDASSFVNIMSSICLSSSKPDIQKDLAFLVCPMRLIRSSACRVSPGVHGRSRRMMEQEAVNVRPTPPVVIQQTKKSDSLVRPCLADTGMG